MVHLHNDQTFPSSCAKKFDFQDTMNSVEYAQKLNGKFYNLTYFIQIMAVLLLY